jgi:hypothetical protein
MRDFYGPSSSAFNASREWYPLSAATQAGAITIIAAPAQPQPARSTITLSPTLVAAPPAPAPSVDLITNPVGARRAEMLLMQVEAEAAMIERGLPGSITERECDALIDRTNALGKQLDRVRRKLRVRAA